jgi:hypothetical protein
MEKEWRGVLRGGGSIHCHEAFAHRTALDSRLRASVAKETHLNFGVILFPFPVVLAGRFDEDIIHIERISVPSGRIKVWLGTWISLWIIVLIIWHWVGHLQAPRSHIPLQVSPFTSALARDRAMLE